MTLLLSQSNLVGFTWESLRSTSKPLKHIISAIVSPSARYSDHGLDHETTNCCFALPLNKGVSKIYDIFNGRLMICDVTSPVNTKICGEAWWESNVLHEYNE